MTLQSFDDHQIQEIQNILPYKSLLPISFLLLTSLILSIIIFFDLKGNQLAKPKSDKKKKKKSILEFVEYEGFFWRLINTKPPSVDNIPYTKNECIQLERVPDSFDGYSYKCLITGENQNTDKIDNDAKLVNKLLFTNGLKYFIERNNYFKINRT